MYNNGINKIVKCSVGSKEAQLACVQNADRFGKIVSHKAELLSFSDVNKFM